MNYSKLLLEHYYAPRNVGALPDDTSNLIIVQAGSEAAGEVVQFFVQLENQTIKQMTFKAHGSVATIAACSWITEQLTLQPLSTITEIDEQKIIQFLELPQTKRHCALLIVDALSKLLK